MLISKTDKIQSAVSALLVFTAVAITYFMRGSSYFDYQSVIAVLYVSVYIIWMYSIRRRFIQRNVRKYMTAFAYMIIAINVLRLIKHKYTVENSFVNRQLWYLGYLFILMMPVLMFVCTMYLGKPDHYVVSSKWKLLFVPAVLFAVGFVTNDLHQLAFRFDDSFVPGSNQWNGYYTYGPLYYIAVAFVTVGVLAIFIMAFRVGSKKRFRKNMWMPLLLLVAGAFYWIHYIRHIHGETTLPIRLFGFYDAISLISIGYWESLVLAHLIPSNANHQDFFKISSINAGLTDRHYQIRLRAANSEAPSAVQIQFADSDSVLLSGGNLLLKSRPVQGGYFYWTENIKEINRLNKELMETADYLAEEQTMLDTAVKIEESRKRTEEESRLYDIIAQRIKPQLDAIDLMINHLPEDETEFRRVMRYAAVLNAYIKRYSNLILIGSNNRMIGSDELGMAVCESLEYVKLMEIVCHADIQEGISIPSETALSVYEIFETVLESALPDTDAVLVTLSSEENFLVLKMEVSSPTSLFTNAQIETVTEDDIEYITCRISMGGDE